MTNIYEVRTGPGALASDIEERLAETPVPCGLLHLTFTLVWRSLWNNE